MVCGQAHAAVQRLAVEQHATLQPYQVKIDAVCTGGLREVGRQKATKTL